MAAVVNKKTGGTAGSGTGVAGATGLAGALLYVKPNGTFGLADATAEGKEAVAVAKTDFTAGLSVDYFGPGNTITGLSGLTPGTRYFMTTTPGAIGAVPATTGNVALCIGTAITATSLLFTPEVPVTL